MIDEITFEQELIQELRIMNKFLSRLVDVGILINKILLKGIGGEWVMPNKKEKGK